MNSTDVIEQIEKMGELPSLPQTLLQIQKVATDTGSSADDLATCILTDQALTMRVLKAVNSAMFQRRNQEQVRTVQRSVVVMGFETVRKLALSLSVFDMMSKLSRSPFLSVITRHSLLTAGIAEILAKAGRGVAPEEAFVTGLIHDIGKVVLLECSPAHMDMVLNDVAEGVDQMASERKHFGITHSRAGKRLAKRWQLPKELQSVIGEHHDVDPIRPPRNLDPLLGVIAYADAISRFTGEPDAQSNESRILSRAAKFMGVAEDERDDLAARVADELGDLGSILGMSLEELHDFGEVVNVDGSVSVAPRSMSPAEVARRTAAQMALYRDVGEGLAKGADADDLLHRILAGAVDILGFERVVLLRVDRAARLLQPWLWEGTGAAELAGKLALPFVRETGALALAVLDSHTYHVPHAASDAYAGLAGDALLEAARCTGFVVTPVTAGRGAQAVLYADCGSEGADVAAEQAHELSGFALQIGLILEAGQPA